MPVFSGLLTPNIIEIIILIVLVIYVLIGLSQGFLVSFVQLVSYVGSAFLAFKFAEPLTKSFGIYVPLPLSLTTSVFFLLTILLSQYCFHKIITVFSENISHSYQGFKKNPLFKVLSPINHLLGVFPGLVEGLFFASLIMCLIFFFAPSRNAKFFVLESKNGRTLAQSAAKFELKVKQDTTPIEQTQISSWIADLDGENITRIPHVESLNQYDQITQEESLLRLNALRRKHSQSPIIFDQDVSQQAQIHASNIFARGYISTFDNSGAHLENWLEAQSIPTKGATMNIVFAPKDQIPVLDSFEATDGAELKAAKENFLSDKFKEIGLGIAQGKNHQERIFVFIFTAVEEESL